MYVKELHGVVNVCFRIRHWGGRHGTRTDDGLKDLDQGNDRDEWGTCI